VRLQRFLTIWRATVRMQLAGLLGNVLAAAPLVLLLDRGYLLLRGRHFFDAHTAQHALHANSLLGPSVLYAALTGLLLWLSSLLGAAADNWTRVSELFDRLSTNLRVMRGIGPARARPIAAHIVAKVGGLASNVSLGFMLGGIPAAFAIASLPVEIRHVTVSTGAVALAWAAEGVSDTAGLLWAVAGVVAIGLINVSVSFALALRLALSSIMSRGSNRAAGLLVRAAIRRWLRGRAVRQPMLPQLAAAEPTSVEPL
jgi:site-specific recombinase